MKDDKNAFGIIIVAHGRLAHEYLSTLQHVIGVQNRIHAISIDDRDIREDKRTEICSLAQKIDTGSGVVIATDMYGGTPSNLALSCLPKGNHRILYGVNMPALIKLTRLRHQPVDQALRGAVAAGHRYLNFCTDQRKKNV